MVHKTVYLAGTISGLTYSEATSWRDKVTIELREVGIRALSPIRNKVYIREMQGDRIDQASPATETQEDIASYVKAMSNQRGITTRDRFDCMNCTVLFVNLLGAKKLSIGTIMEIAWADSKRRPIVLVMEEESWPVIPFEERGWFAGIVDGEGHIDIKKNKLKSGNYTYKPQVRVEMNCKAVIDRLAEVSNLGAVMSTFDKRVNKTRHIWQAAGQEAASILRDIWPRLIEKQSRAATVIEMARATKGRGRNHQKGKRGFALKTKKESQQQAEIYERFRATYNPGAIVVYQEPPPPIGNQHNHAMIRECSGFVVPTICEGIEIVKAILADY